MCFLPPYPMIQNFTGMANFSLPLKLDFYDFSGKSDLLLRRIDILFINYSDNSPLIYL